MDVVISLLHGTPRVVGGNDITTVLFGGSVDPYWVGAFTPAMVLLVVLAPLMCCRFANVRDDGPVMVAVNVTLLVALVGLLVYDKVLLTGLYGVQGGAMQFVVVVDQVVVDSQLLEDAIFEAIVGLTVAEARCGSSVPLEHWVSVCGEAARKVSDLRGHIHSLGSDTAALQNHYVPAANLAYRLYFNAVVLVSATLCLLWATQLLKLVWPRASGTSVKTTRLVLHVSGAVQLLVVFGVGAGLAALSTISADICAPGVSETATEVLGNALNVEDLCTASRTYELLCFYQDCTTETIDDWSGHLTVLANSIAYVKTNGSHTDTACEEVLASELVRAESMLRLAIALVDDLSCAHVQPIYLGVTQVAFCDEFVPAVGASWFALATIAVGFLVVLRVGVRFGDDYLPINDI